MEIRDYIRGYEKTNAATSLIIGFSYEHNAYMTRVSLWELESCLKLDVRTKDGQPEETLRLVMRKADKARLREHAMKLGTEEEVFSCLPKTHESYKNRGCNFEAYVAARFAGKPIEGYRHDSTPYYEKGDINLFGEEVQLKVDGATIAPLRMILKAMEGR